MITRILIPALATAALFITACTKTPAGGSQRATVVMRDGTDVSGTILTASSNEIQLAGDDKVTRTIPMTQVRTIEYQDAPLAPVAPTEPPSAAPANPLPPASAPVPPQPRELVHREHYHPVEAAITTTTYALPVGTEISVRTEETIDSQRAVEGQTFPAEVLRDVLDSSGRVVIPRGSNAPIVIRSTSRGGHFRGTSDLVMDLDSVSVDGRRYEISTEDMAERGRAGIGANRRTGEFTGGGAAIGAIIGAIAGGGRGAAIGAGSGAGAGALTQIITKGTIRVPVESVLTFRLDRPLRVHASR